MNPNPTPYAGPQLPNNIFLTGLPGVGKTTVIGKTLRSLDVKATGFYTSELREGGTRVGFSIATLDGRQGILARVGLKGKHRVGRYVVNEADLERVALPSIAPSSESQLVVIDEVGKMECVSQRFREAVLDVLAAPNPVLGTIAMKGGGFIEQVRWRPDIELHHVTTANRDNLPRLLADRLRHLLLPRS